MAQRETPSLDSLLEDIKTLKEGCDLLDEIRSFGYYELRVYIESHFKNKDRNEMLNKLYGFDGLFTRFDRYFKFDDNE